MNTSYAPKLKAEAAKMVDALTPAQVLKAVQKIPFDRFEKIYYSDEFSDTLKVFAAGLLQGEVEDFSVQAAFSLKMGADNQAATNEIMGLLGQDFAELKIATVTEDDVTQALNDVSDDDLLALIERLPKDLRDKVADGLLTLDEKDADGNPIILTDDEGRPIRGLQAALSARMEHEIGGEVEAKLANAPFVIEELESGRYDEKISELYESNADFKTFVDDNIRSGMMNGAVGKMTLADAGEIAGMPDLGLDALSGKQLDDISLRDIETALADGDLAAFIERLPEETQNQVREALQKRSTSVTDTMSFDDAIDTVALEGLEDAKNGGFWSLDAWKAWWNKDGTGDNSNEAIARRTTETKIIKGDKDDNGKEIPGLAQGIYDKIQDTLSQARQGTLAVEIDPARVPDMMREALDDPATRERFEKSLKEDLPDSVKKELSGTFAASLMQSGSGEQSDAIKKARRQIIDGIRARIPSEFIKMRDDFLSGESFSKQLDGMSAEDVYRQLQEKLKTPNGRKEILDSLQKKDAAGVTLLERLKEKLKDQDVLFLAQLLPDAANQAISNNMQEFLISSGLMEFLKPWIDMAVGFLKDMGILSA
ncbi:MAG: hypothetical protein ACPGRX_08695, partial [Bdellovibrionales bacterium]